MRIKRSTLTRNPFSNEHKYCYLYFLCIFVLFHNMLYIMNMNAYEMHFHCSLRIILLRTYNTYIHYMHDMYAFSMHGKWFYFLL